MTSTKGRPVLIETDRFRLRSLKPIDASDRWLGWAKDPEVMAPLNVKPVTMTRQDLSQHIASSDNQTRFLIGIFDKESKIQIGFYMVEADEMHRSASFNVVIGEKAWWGKSVVNETREALLDHFFEERNVEKACGSPLARNIPAIFNYLAQGWKHEGTLRSQRLSVFDGSRLDQFQFGITRDSWRTMRHGRR